MRMITVLRSVILSLGLLPFAGAALADGIELPAKVRPGFGGQYVVRATLVTSNNVTGLQYAPFTVTPDGRIGEEVPGFQLRPTTINTRAGEKRQVLVTFPAAQTFPSSRLALCMWRQPDVPKSDTSQMINAFRYCKLFAAES
jgi:hypothetical protein